MTAAVFTLGGRHADKPPGDREGFLAYAQQLRTPTISNAVRGAKQLGEVARFGFPASVWRHFEQVRAVSAWIVADWRCSMPVRSRIWSRHERGCTASASAAGAFSQASARTRTVGGTRVGFLCWGVLADRDALGTSRYSGFCISRDQRSGPRDLARSFEFRAALTRLAARDPDVHKPIVEVQPLVKPPSILCDPEVLKRIRAVASIA